jgi:hypothetical protein
MGSSAITHSWMGTSGPGITATGILLERNGWRLETTNDELERFTLRVASDHPPLDEIVEWLRSRCQPTGPGPS